MSYSTNSDLFAVLPSASGMVDNSDFTGTFNTLVTAVRTVANKWVDSYIRRVTAVPSAESGTLALPEALYSAYLITQGTSAVGSDATLAYADRFRDEAKQLLDEAEFPATATTPAAASGFTGDGTITVTVTDWTPTAMWEARYQNSGVFEIWNSKDGTVGYYDLDDDVRFPDPTDGAVPSASAIKSIVVSITEGSTDFAANDTWTWRTYSATRARKGIRFQRLGLG